MSEPRLGYAFRAALRPALDDAPGMVRYTITITATRRARGRPMMVIVELEAVGEDGQARHRVGCADEHDGPDEPFSLALRRAVLDDPTERHLSDVLEWLGIRAAEASDGLPLVNRP